MAAREHVLGLVGEVMDTAAARHSDDDFLDVKDEILSPWMRMPGTDNKRTTVVVR